MGDHLPEVGQTIEVRDAPCSSVCASSRPREAERRRPATLSAPRSGAAPAYRGPWVPNKGLSCRGCVGPLLAQLFWPDDKKWYRADVLGVNFSKRTADVLYATGDVENLDLDEARLSRRPVPTRDDANFIPTLQNLSHTPSRPTRCLCALRVLIHAGALGRSSVTRWDTHLWR